MHYPHQSNANAPDHFIVLQYPSRHSCNYFISFTSFMQITYGNIDNIISSPIHTYITLIKVMQMHWIILVVMQYSCPRWYISPHLIQKCNYSIILDLCNTLMPRLYFISYNWKMQYPIHTLIISYPTIFTFTLPYYIMVMHIL
jgi:hypothetical protein